MPPPPPRADVNVSWKYYNEGFYNNGLRQSLAGGRRALDPQLDRTMAPLKKFYKPLCFRGAPSGIPLAAAAPRKLVSSFLEDLTVSSKPL